MRWAQRCKAAHGGSPHALFGIVQGGMYPALRRESLQQLTAIGFDGYALGGLSVGEPKEEMLAILDAIAPELPADKPRYVMGVGTPADLVDAVCRGIDMFDCVLPTRNARNAYLFTSRGLLRIRGMLPPGTPVADKTGTIGGATNDVGVITLPDGGEVAVVVFVKNSERPVADREKVIAQVSRSAYDYFLFTGK